MSHNRFPAEAYRLLSTSTYLFLCHYVALQHTTDWLTGTEVKVLFNLHNSDEIELSVCVCTYWRFRFHFLSVSYAYCEWVRKWTEDSLIWSDSTSEESKIMTEKTRLFAFCYTQVSENHVKHTSLYSTILRVHTQHSILRWTELKSSLAPLMSKVSTNAVH